MFLFKNHRWVISPRNLIAYLNDIDVLEYESFDTNVKVMENPTGFNENLNTSGKEELILDSKENIIQNEYVFQETVSSISKLINDYLNANLIVLVAVTICFLLF